MRVVSPETCRPFSKDRRGMILGEGGAMLVLEPLEAARARARVFTRKSWASACPPMPATSRSHPPKAPRGHAGGLARCRPGARTDRLHQRPRHRHAGQRSHRSGGHPLRFGPHAERLAISSTKSMHGHTLGAAAALECLATALALRDGVLPPTATSASPIPSATWT